MLLLYSALTATAYYDPGAQRWMNRDPFDELGFEHIRNAPPHADEANAALFGNSSGTSSQVVSLARTRMLPLEVNLYTYVANRPLGEVDAYGLELLPPMGPESPLGTPGTPTPDNCAPCSLDAAAGAVSVAAGVTICVEGAGSSAGRIACRGAVLATAAAAKKLSDCLRKNYGF
jgi:hypothetical protein